MLTRRTLKNCITEEKPNLRKRDACSTKCKQGEKENQFKKSNLITDCNLKNRKKSTSMVLKSSKNRLVEKAILEKNDFSTLLGKENKLKRTGIKETVKQNVNRSKLPVLKEHNISTKNIKPVIVRKNKKNVDQKSIKLKDSHKPKVKLETCMEAITVNQHLKISEKQHNVCAKRKCSKAEDVLKPVTGIPIWKKESNLNKSKQKKLKRKVDVYDIALDEDFMASEKEEKKLGRRNPRKKICSPKKPKNVAKKKGPICRNESKKIQFFSCNTVNLNDKKSAVKTDPVASDLIDKKLTTVKEKELFFPSDPKMNNNITPDFHEENINEDCLFSSVEINNPCEIVNESNLDLQPLESKFQSKKLSDLFDELEKSFEIPRMTSTPDAMQGKPGEQIQKKGILSVPDVSNITNININSLNATVSTPNDSVCDDPLLKESEDNDECEITLFESPIKEEKKKKKLNSPKKLVQMNLFDEVVNTPCKESDLEHSVLKPSKAYHTPDNFKAHLIPAKRKAAINKKETKKSKVDIWSEKMAQHFEDVDSTELLIEIA